MSNDNKRIAILGTLFIVLPLLKLNYLEAGCPEDCRSHADLPAYCTGRASRLEIDSTDILRPGKVQYLLGSPDELIGEIGTGFCKHPGGPGQDIGSVTAADVGGLPRGWQATKLLWTDWDPEGRLKCADTRWIFKSFAVIAGAKTDKAGTDKTGRK